MEQIEMNEFLYSKLLPGLWKYLIKSFKKRKEEFEVINNNFVNPIELSKVYIEPNCQHGNPADEEDVASPINRPVFAVLNDFLSKKFIEKDGRRHLFVLADAGMGKTSLLLLLLLMIKLYSIMKFWPKKYNCELLKLGSDSIINMNNMPNKANTILLLDSLDEDPLAWQNYENRILQIIKASLEFNKVIISCRTQFFPQGQKDPFDRAGNIVIGGYTCPKFYLSLFNDTQIRQYLEKRFKKKVLFFFEKKNVKKICLANTICKRMKSLRLRPFRYTQLTKMR